MFIFFFNFKLLLVHHPANPPPPTIPFLSAGTGKPYKRHRGKKEITSHKAEASCFSHFSYMWETWGPLTWGWPQVVPFSEMSFSSAYRKIDAKMLLKKAFSHLLAITRDTHNGDREKSSDQAHIWTMSHGQNLSSISGEADPFALYFFENCVKGVNTFNK